MQHEYYNDKDGASHIEEIMPAKRTTKTFELTRNGLILLPRLLARRLVSIIAAAINHDTRACTSAHPHAATST